MKLPTYKQLVLMSIAIAFAMTCFAAYLINQITIVEQRYDELYKHKENILEQLIQEQNYRANHLEVYGHWYEYQQALDSLEACDGIDRGNSINNVRKQ